MISRSLAAMAVVATALIIGCDKSGLVPPTAPTPPPAAPATPSSPPAPPVPAPMRTISGVVQRHDGQPLPGVTIRPASGGQYTSDGSGGFRFPFPGSDTYGGTACVLYATAEGFEPRDIGWGIGMSDVNLPPFFLTPRLTLVSGGVRDGVLLNDDLGFWIGEDYDSDLCWPCHRVHIETDVVSKMRLTLSWSGPTPLQFWVGGRLIDPTTEPGDNQATTEFTATAAGDTLVHIGLKNYPRTRELPSPVSYRLTTTGLPR